jgi:hypothetical protein
MPNIQSFFPNFREQMLSSMIVKGSVLELLAKARIYLNKLEQGGLLG